jgi:ABC-type amino acid transport substrate-binding protein
MKKKLLAIILSVFCVHSFAQSTQYTNALKSKSGTLVIEYFDNFPYAYKDASGHLTGIEVDILNTFVNWLKVKKGVSLTVDYNANSDFAQFYSNVKTKKNVGIGAGSVTIMSERLREVKFSSPYLRNKSMLVTSISVPGLTDLNKMSKQFEGMTAVVVKGSVHEKALNEIKSSYFPQMKVEYVESPNKVIEKIATDSNYFGLVDIISFWAALQKSDINPIKSHKVSLGNSENFGFIFPKDGDWYTPFSEFFDAGFGFTESGEYEAILRKHLGFEVLKTVRVSY